MPSIGNYEKVADIYAAAVDHKPIHIYYERPHTCSLLPKSLANLNVLDLGCGSGWYAEYLVKAGANVTAIDASAKMVELTKERLQGKGKVFVADLEEPLDFLKSQYFDVVLAPLVIHYIKDWQSLFLQISRVLKNNGLFVGSTHQPCTEQRNFNLTNYYEKVLIKDYWPNLKIEVQYYHHTLHELSASLANNNMVIECLLEPQPLPELKAAEPEIYEKITTQPWFLFIRAKKLMK